MEPKFLEGDKVVYETSILGCSPRWFWGQDYGSSGEWLEGEVVAVQSTKIIVCSDLGDISVWPLSGHMGYDSAQWNWPGFIRLKDMSSQTNAEKRCRCVCGSDAVYGVGSGLHAHWCDLS